MGKINIFDTTSIIKEIENSSTSKEAREKIREIFRNEFNESFQDFFASLTSSSDDVDNMGNDEYKETLSKMLEKLDEQERIGAIEIIRQRAENYEDEAKNSKYPSMSFRKLIYLDIQSMVDSHNASLLHNASTLSVDLNSIEHPSSCDDTLRPEEILLLSKINGKHSTKELPGYFTHEYHINYNQTLKKLFSSGYLSFAPTSYKLNKLKTSELKEMLSKKNLSTKGKKEDFVNLLAENLSEKEIKKLPDYFVLTAEGEIFLEENAALLLYYNGFSHSEWTTPEEIISLQSSYKIKDPGKNPHDILIEQIDISIKRLEQTISFYKMDRDTILSWKNNLHNE